MTQGYIIQLGQVPNTYTGFRMATDTMECHDGEQFVTTLDGWRMIQPPPMPSPAIIYQGYKAWFATNITAQQRILFSTPDGVIRRGFEDWQSEATPYNKVKMIELLEALKKIQGVEAFQADIDRLIENCKLVVETGGS